MIPIPEPLPQVGALLCRDTELPVYLDDVDGGKHWKLAGSCVLVAPDLVLTIGHILGERDQPSPFERYRVFLPYHGLLEIAEQPPNPNEETQNPDWEDYQVPGDNLALIRLKDPVGEGAPLRPRKVKSIYKNEGQALVCGYGSWPSTDQGRREGIQQRHTVRLGPPRNGRVQWRHYDNLDLSWSASDHEGLFAGRGNSGGPMLKVRGDSLPPIVVGITRETGADQQAGAWITWQRWRWLREPTQPVQRQAQDDQSRREYRLLTIDGTGQSIPFQVPNGVSRVRATLNASQGMRLQMGIVPADQSAGLLQQLATNDQASGRFLCRTLDDLKGATEIAIGVCPVARAPRHAKEVLAQLCVLFL